MEILHGIAEDASPSTPGWRVDPKIKVGGSSRSGESSNSSRPVLFLMNRQPTGGSGKAVEEVAMTCRVMRAERLVHVGELSSARQALEGSEVAPGTRSTLDQLQDR